MTYPLTRFGEIMQAEGRKFTWLSERTGIASSRLGEWARGIGYGPGAVNQAKIAEALGRTVDEIFPRELCLSSTRPLTKSSAE